MNNLITIRLLILIHLRLVKDSYDGPYLATEPSKVSRFHLYDAHTYILRTIKMNKRKGRDDDL